RVPDWSIRIFCLACTVQCTVGPASGRRHGSSTCNFRGRRHNDSVCTSLYYGIFLHVLYRPVMAPLTRSRSRQKRKESASTFSRHGKSVEPAWYRHRATEHDPPKVYTIFIKSDN